MGISSPPRHWTFGVGLVFFILPIARGLRCYSCDDCQDPFYPSLDFTQDCRPVSDRLSPGESEETSENRPFVQFTEAGDLGRGSNSRDSARTSGNRFSNNRDREFGSNNNGGRARTALSSGGSEDAKTPVCVKITSRDGSTQRGCGSGSQSVMPGCRLLHADAEVCSCSGELCNSTGALATNNMFICAFLFLTVLIGHRPICVTC